MNAVKRYIKENGLLFTIFMVILILFGGTATINNPEQWWVIPSILVVVFSLILIFNHARAVFKAAITVIAVVGLASLGFMIGTANDPILQLSGVIWFFSTVVVALLSLAISYLTFSVRSRWTATTLAVVTQFTVSYLVMLSFLNLYAGVISGSIAGIIVFCLFYFSKGWRWQRSSLMPQNIASDVLTENIKEAFTKEGYEFRDMREKSNKGGYLVWKEKAYLIYPIRMEKDFEVYTRTELRYNNKNINPWLAMVTTKNTPSFRAKNASIMTVLLDLTNSNGNAGKVIGMSTPDTKKKTPVGIFPGRELNSSRDDKSGIIQNFEKRFSGSTLELTEKHKEALKGIGIRKK